MTEIKELHREFAIQCFNGVWEFLDKKGRTQNDDTQMIHMADASRYHWGQIGTPLEFARGDWQLSRVYAILGIGAMANKYAENCLDLCEKHDFGDFDLAFAFEALVRASAVAGDIAKGKEYLSQAKSAAAEIKKTDDQEYFHRELKSVLEML